nr:reverse transcriptase domain-containing protein [Tanacetum cinerariifolium]
MEQELYNLRMKGMDIDGYTNRFHELALLCLRMVEPEAVKVDNTFEADEATEGEKRKGESDRRGRGDNRCEHNRRQNQRRELGSFDVVIGMDWLSKNDAAILCGEKKVRIPLKNKALIIE